MQATAKTLRLARLIAAITAADWEELGRIRRAAPPGEPDGAWRETVLMSHLFAGFPRQIQAYETLGEHGGLGPPNAAELREDAAPVGEGERLFRQLYGANTTRVQHHLATLNPTFASWIHNHAYGRVLSRTGLSPLDRELCVVAALTVLDQGKQLAGHVRGASALGATQPALLAIVGEVADLAPAGAATRARAIIAQFGKGQSG